MSKLFVNTIAPNSGDTVTVSGSLTTTGKLTIGDQASDTVAITAEVSSSIIPDADLTYNLGSESNRWNKAFIHTVSASVIKGTGSLVLKGESIGTSELIIKDFGTSTVHGPIVVKGYQGLGVGSVIRMHDLLGTNYGEFQSAIGPSGFGQNFTYILPKGSGHLALTTHASGVIDSIGSSSTGASITGSVNISGSVLPDAGATYALGTMAKSWGSLHVHGLGHIHTASIGFVSSSLLPVTNTTGFIDRSPYDLGSLSKKWNRAYIQNTFIGTASLDHVTSSLIPGTDDVFDIGSDSKQWKDLYIDGTANIDTLSAQSASIDNINIDGNTISSTGGTDLNIIPKAGQQIVLDENIIIDSGSITGVHSLVAANVSPSNLTGSQFNIDGFNINTKIETVSIGTASLDHVVLTTRTIGASVDSDTYTAHGSKVEVRSQLQAQLDDGTFAAFRLHNNSIAAESIVMGAFTGGTAGAITASFISANTIGANTASFRIHNETGGNIANDTGFTASFVVL